MHTRDMNVARWETISSVFAHALERPEGERLSFVAEACGSDADLRREVEALLARQQEADAFFDAFAETITPERIHTAPQDLSGKVIGPYRLTRLLGRGGMGVVYLAERNEGGFEQRVALKLLPYGVSHEHVQRFQAERQMLARLKHPHIARLLDGGLTEDGTPYFVMDFVDGVPLTTYCDTQALSVDQRLVLFQQVCSAVQYAHQNLIVHRDLKPSNILVDAKGRVKLLDFGIAKLLDEQPDLGEGMPRTQTGLRLMTPEYASPEQVRNESITTASDVYQLGVLLYELLTGRRPYQLGQRMLREVERVILEEEPTRPSTALTTQAVDEATATAISRVRQSAPDRLRRRLRGDLDYIILKALRKEAPRRYSSAEAFAADVQRHLAGLPVQAQPDRLGYRVRKFVRRNRALLGALTFVFVALSVGLGAAVWQGRVAAQERDRAERQLLFASEISGFMKGMFFYFANALPPDVSPSPLEVLQEGVVQAEQLNNDPELAGAVLHEVADLHMWIQEYERADTLFNRVMALRQGAEGRMKVLERLATSARLQGDLDRARPLYEEAVALGEATLDPEDEALAFVLNTYAIHLEKQGDFDAAEDVQRRLVAMRRTLPLDQHANRAQLAVVLDNLGVTLSRKGDLRGAFEVSEEAYHHRSRIEQDMAGESGDIPWSLSNLVSFHFLLGEWDEAMSMVDELIARATRVYGADHTLAVGGHRLKASILIERGDVDAAEDLITSALEANGSGSYPDLREKRNLQGLMGRIYQHRGQLEAADSVFSALWREVYPGVEATGKSTEAGVIALRRGLVAAEAQNNDEAARWLAQGLQVEEATFTAGHYRIGLAHVRLAEGVGRLGQHAEAVMHLETGLPILVEQLGQSHPYTQQAYDLQAASREALNQPE